MSLCSTCFNAEDLPTCVEEVTFGTIDTTDETVTVYVKNLATDRIDAYVGNVSAGIVTVDDIKVPSSLMFELWCTLVEDSINERLAITNGSREYLCIDFKAVKVNSGIAYPSHDLMVLE